MPAPPRNEPAPARENPDAHAAGPASFGVVYVNETARRALLEEKRPQFPAGSIIVREKLARSDDAVPQLLVALIKREPGFNPQANDWEFLLLDGKATAVQRREKTGSCRDCHARQKETDFVFRTYLSEDARQRQR